MGNDGVTTKPLEIWLHEKKNGNNDNKIIFLS